jgi:hypothetical protein
MTIFSHVHSVERISALSFLQNNGERRALSSATFPPMLLSHLNSKTKFVGSLSAHPVGIMRKEACIRCGRHLWFFLSRATDSAHDGQHLFREAPCHYTHLEGEQVPCMVLIVYYLAEFWPVTKHLVGLITNAWKAAGWPVCVNDYF